MLNLQVWIIKGLTTTEES